LKKETILTIVVCVLVIVSGLGGYGFAVLTHTESEENCQDCPDYPSEPFPEIDYACYSTGTRPEGPLMMFVWGFDESQNVWFHTSTMYFNLTGENRIYTCFEKGTGELVHAKMP